MLACVACVHCHGLVQSRCLVQGGLLGASSIGGVVASLAVGLGVGCGLEWALPWQAMQRRQSILILRQCGWFFHGWLSSDFTVGIGLMKTILGGEA